MRTCAVTRSSGRAPSAGVPNSPSSTPFLASSIVVPSMAVTSMPFHSRPIPRSASVTAASSPKTLFMTCSPSSFLAWENALPDGISAPGRRFRPGSPNAVASTLSYPAPGNRQATSTQITVIFAVSTRSYLCPAGASRSARVITSSASSSSSRPCRSSSASHSVQNPGPDAIRAAISAASSLPSPPCGAAGVDAGPMTMANLAVNKAPGERKGRRQPRSYQELCSISGTTGSRHATAINMQPDRDQPPENQTPDLISPETLGQWSRT